ncbi:hypothetical protein E4U09_004618 [Claviceps aff. purpurea]|uniref:Uncharacterized protein n=1 Tax=Claviceps aff. purpurea TaxID=1967640 RepID=A0A9P7QFJ3_9HYPO|nr:hypothetical protein E4U09_004618 [Claviceps aff. purpurea]
MDDGLRWAETLLACYTGTQALQRDPQGIRINMIFRREIRLLMMYKAQAARSTTAIGLKVDTQFPAPAMRISAG